jgi:hypothetical protein
MTWLQIAQGITNMFSAGQSVFGNRDGGWRYFPGDGDSDSSTTQWAVISLIYDQTLGATTPTTVKDHLKNWLAGVQAANGSVCYQPGTEPCDHSDTGGFLLAKKFVGADLNDPQVMNALNFLNTYWTAMVNNTWYGNIAHPYAMWSVYKGLDVTIGLRDTTYITNGATNCGAPNNLPGNPPGSVPCNWWEDYNQYLCHMQLSDGSWPAYGYWSGTLATAWAINILSATKVPVGNPVLDDFNRANGTLGPNWTGAISTKQYFIFGNKVLPKSGDAIYWAKDTFGKNQEAFVTLTKIDQYSTDEDLLLKVQKGKDGKLNYKNGFIEVTYNHQYGYVSVATQLPGYAWYEYQPIFLTKFAAGDRLGAKALSNGQVLILKNDTVIGGVILNAKDQAFFNNRGGNIGLYFMSDPDGFFDDFGGGNLPDPGVAPPFVPGGGVLGGS